MYTSSPVLCPENASNKAVTALDWITGTINLCTYRTPAGFPVFEWVWYWADQNLRLNIRYQQQNHFGPPEYVVNLSASHLAFPQGNPGTVTIPQYWFNKTKQHTHDHTGVGYWPPKKRIKKSRKQSKWVGSSRSTPSTVWNCLIGS